MEETPAEISAVSRKRAGNNDDEETPSTPPVKVTRKESIVEELCSEAETEIFSDPG